MTAALLAHHAAIPAFKAAFYATIATVIPVLFLAIAVCTPAGGQVSDRYVRDMLRRMAARAGVERRVHPHALRHTFADECGPRFRVLNFTGGRRVSGGSGPTSSPLRR